MQVFNFFPALDLKSLDSEPHDVVCGVVKSYDRLGFVFLSQFGKTPLHVASSNGGLEVVRHLCVAGVNTEAITNVSHGT